MPFLKYKTLFSSKEYAIIYYRNRYYISLKTMFYIEENDVFQLFISDKILCLKFGMVEHDDTHKPRSIDQRELPIRSRNS